ncbi:hypothetical protein [Sinomicrobium sp. M5D2P9]
MNQKQVFVKETSLSVVEIFVTNVGEETIAEECVEVLSCHFPEHRINFDLEDKDKILRMEGPPPDVKMVIAVLAILKVQSELFPDEE